MAMVLSWAVRVHSDNAACVMACTKKFETRHSSHVPKLQLTARDRRVTGEMSMHKAFATWNPADLGAKAPCASQFMTHTKAWMETHVPPHQMTPSAKACMPEHKFDALMGNPWQNMNIKRNPFRETVPKRGTRNPFRTQAIGNPFREVHSRVQGERNQGGSTSEPPTDQRKRGKQAATTECATCKRHTTSHDRTRDSCNAPAHTSKAKRGNPFKDNAGPSRKVRQNGNATATSDKSQKGSAATPRGGHTATPQTATALRRTTRHTSACALQTPPWCCQKHSATGITITAPRQKAGGSHAHTRVRLHKRRQSQCAQSLSMAWTPALQEALCGAHCKRR